MTSEDLLQAKTLWEAGRALEARRILTGLMRRDELPAWGARILKFAQKFAPPAPAVAAVIDIAGDSSRWREARAAFVPCAS